MTAVAQVAADGMTRASVAVTVAGAALLAVAGLAGLPYVVLAVALGGFVIAFGLAPIMGATNRHRSSLVLALATFLGAAAVLTVESEPALRLLPVAVAVSVIVMFLVQLTRADNRPRLSACLACDALGIGVITSGMTFAPLAHAGSGRYPVTLAMAAIGLSCLLDPLLKRPRAQGLLFPAAAVAGAMGALAANAWAAAPVTAATAVLIGAVSGGIAHAMRRTLAEQAVVEGRGTLTVAAAGLLTPGLAVFTIAHLLG
ncbi:MAG: hypothetical protein V9G19_24410 [Tetrasphaera sp.]